MCGIVGAVAQRDVAPILLEGLKRLEYRGYDSAGMAVSNGDGHIDDRRVTGKVSALEQALDSAPLPGASGIAHTRWATHGVPSDRNAHPHLCEERVALVHNGIIENHAALKSQQLLDGHEFSSETDTEVIVHLVHDFVAKGRELLDAVMAATAELDGAYAVGVISRDEPGRMIAARRGSPLVIGIGIGEHFIASDVFALLPVTQRFVFLEDGDFADIRRDGFTIYDENGKEVERNIVVSELTPDAAEKSGYRHFMLKEIFGQPRAIAETLEGRIESGSVPDSVFGPNATEILDNIDAVQIVACGTSYHAGLVARYWFESIAGVPCNVEVASEFRYRTPVVNDRTLFVTVSQSGETADTLAALREAKKWGFAHSLAICNVPESSLTRESELVLMTRAGPEIGVASTKAFTTQLVAFMLLVIALGRRRNITPESEARLVGHLESLPGRINAALELNDLIERWAELFANCENCLYLGRAPPVPAPRGGAAGRRGDRALVHLRVDRERGDVLRCDPGVRRQRAAHLEPRPRPRRRGDHRCPGARRTSRCGRHRRPVRPVCRPCPDPRTLRGGRDSGDRGRGRGDRCDLGRSIGRDVR